MREEYLEAIFARLQTMKEEMPKVLENKPWISEDEHKDVNDKIDEAVSWLNEKVEAQNAVGLSGDPAFSMDSVQPKIEKVTKLHKKVTGKKKPKEKKSKEAKTEEKAEDGEEHEHQQETDL
jgi:hypothetical protein